MKKKLYRYLPLFICMLFFLPAFTSWGTTINTITIDGADPTGEVYRGSVSVGWTVTGETSGEIYDVLYSSTGSGGPWIAPTGGSIASNVVGNGTGPYSVTWDTTTAAGDGSTYWIMIYAQLVPNPTLTDGAFTIQNTPPTITIGEPDPGDSWAGTQNITWTVTGTWPDDEYLIEYSTDSGGSWDTITTVAATGSTAIANLSYAWDTTTIPGEDQPDDDFRIRITGTVSDAIANMAGDFTIDNNLITGINITAPTASDKARGTILVSFDVSGSEKLGEQYLLQYRLVGDTSWKTCNVVDISGTPTAGKMEYA